MEEQPLKSFGKPEGLVGHFLGVVMAKSNKKIGEWTLQVSGIEDGVNALEIGFGPGTTIQFISVKYPHAFIAGIDWSDVMVKQAIRRNKQAIREGRVELQEGSVARIPYDDATFDMVYAINSFQFWTDRLENLKEVRRVLRKDGKIVITMQPRWTKSDEEVKQVGRELTGWLGDASYRNVDLSFLSMKPISVICATGIK